MRNLDLFLKARDFLLEHREDYLTAYRGFRWPEFSHFNWALDYFDELARNNSAPGLILWDGQLETLSFDDLRRRSNQTANYLTRLGLRRHDRILLMLSNVRVLWEVVLAAIKTGAAVIPTATLLPRDDLRDRLLRGQVKFVIAESDETPKFQGITEGMCCIAAGAPVAGWHDYAQAQSSSEEFQADGETLANDPLFLYFTSGTTARPKLVSHSHQSYPVGHLSTLYWVGLKPGDVHWNISSPGWAKHAWSSLFAPWNAAAAVFASNRRFDARETLELLSRTPITSLCAPPTVWRMLIQEDLGARHVPLREVVSAGEPLNPEVMERVHRAWGLWIRDGYGQTETTAQIGNSPGTPILPGSMGRPLPGYRLEILTSEDRPGNEGELVIDMAHRPLGLMTGYKDKDHARIEPWGNGYYRTGDIVRRDDAGNFWYVGRRDDVFKCSDYRVSPFELESLLLEHPAVAEAAVVPSPDPLRLYVPKAFIVLAPGSMPDEHLALELFRFMRERAAPFKRVRRLEFSELPKTLTGKIRRAELRALEQTRTMTRHACEYWEVDFTEFE